MEYLVKVQDYLKLKIKDTYRLAHSYRVTNIGKEIAKKEGLNVEDLMIACLLHDVSDFEHLKDQLKISTAL
ncbi:HD domain-containing protein [Holdemanella biformis]